MYVSVFVKSLEMGVITTVICLALAYPMAYFIAKFDEKFTEYFDFAGYNSNVD